MGAYDSILNAAGQGYGTFNQNAVAQAQMPTFADKFLAGLHGGQDQAYKQQMGMSQLEMNMAYKQAQAQKMRDDAQAADIQRRTGMLGYISKELMPSKYDEVVAQVKAMGGDPSWVSKERFDQGAPEITREMTPVFDGGSLSEGGEQTQTTSPAVEPQAIEGSGWGTDAWLKNRALDIKELSVEQKQMIADAKRERPQDPMGKLTESWLKGLISTPDFNMMRAKMGFIQNPAAGPAATSGFYINPNANQGAASSDRVRAELLGQPTNLTPSTTSANPQAPSTARVPQLLPSGQPNQRVKGQNNGVPLPVAATPMPKKVEETAKDFEATQNFLSSLDRMDSKLDDITGRTPEEKASFKGALSGVGMIKGLLPKTSEYGVRANINVLKSQLMLQAMQALKAASSTGATGMGQLSEKEGEVLRTSVESLDPNMSEADFTKSVLGIKNEIQRLRGLSQQKQGTMTDVRRVPTNGDDVKEYHMEDGTVQKWTKQGGSWKQVQ